MSRYCMTFETAKGPVTLQLASKPKPSELADLQAFADALAAAAPEVTPEQQARYETARQRNHERLERIRKEEER